MLGEINCQCRENRLFSNVLKMQDTNKKTLNIWKNIFKVFMPSKWERIFFIETQTHSKLKGKD